MGVSLHAVCTNQPWVVSPKRPNPASRAPQWYRRSVPNRGTTKIHPAPGGWAYRQPTTLTNCSPHPWSQNANTNILARAARHTKQRKSWNSNQQLTNNGDTRARIALHWPDPLCWLQRGNITTETQSHQSTQLETTNTASQGDTIARLCNVTDTSATVELKRAACFLPHPAYEYHSAHDTAPKHIAHQKTASSSSPASEPLRGFPKPPRTENSMQHGYDENDNNNMSNETKRTNYSTTKWNDVRTITCSQNTTSNDDVYTDACVVHMTHWARTYHALLVHTKNWIHGIRQPRSRSIHPQWRKVKGKNKIKIWDASLDRQNFSHLQRRKLIKELWGRPTTTADFGSLFWQVPFTSNLCLLEDKIQDRDMYLFAILHGSYALDQRSGDGWFSELRSSPSTRCISMPNFEVLDARIASVLNKIIHNSQFKKRISLEEQKAQKEDRFLRGRQIAYLIYDHFRVTGTHDSVENFTDLFTIVLRNGDIHEFDSKWDGILLSMTKIQHDDILEGLYKWRIRESEKLKTVLELYDLETHQKKNRTWLSQIESYGEEKYKKFEMRILGPEAEILRRTPWSRIKEQNSVCKEFLEIVGNGKPTMCEGAATMRISVEKSHHQIRLRILSCGRMSEKHRVPEVPGENVRVVECRDGLARITLEELAITHFPWTSLKRVSRVCPPKHQMRLYVCHQMRLPSPQRSSLRSLTFARFAHTFFNWRN